MSMLCLRRSSWRHAKRLTEGFFDLEHRAARPVIGVCFFRWDSPSTLLARGFRETQKYSKKCKGGGRDQG